MRNLAAVLVAILCVLSVACVDGGIVLQDSQQGEWSNFHNLANKVSKDAQPSSEKPAEK